MGPDWRGRPPSTWLLIGLLGLLAVRGLLGGGQFVVAPSGDLVGVSTSVLAPLPVRDFLLPGLFLFVGLGLLPLIVARALYRDRAWGRVGAILVGVVLAGWAIGEGLLLGWGARLQYVSLLQAVAILILAVVPLVRDVVESGR